MTFIVDPLDRRVQTNAFFFGSVQCKTSQLNIDLIPFQDLLNIIVPLMIG